ncbi:MAG TPA: energy transducer TonB [Polyangia bacterium]
MNPNERAQPPSPAARPAPRRRTLPLPVRKRAARKIAAARVAARTTRGLTPAQRLNDPLARPPRTVANTWVRIVGPLVGTVLVHAAIVAIGFATGAGARGRAEKIEQKVTIEMREPPPPPPLPPTPAEVESPKPTPPVAKAPAPKRQAPAPTPPPDEPPPKTPPPRIVGLSLESTSQTGDGPAFAVGNTREGRTAEQAADPTAVPKEAPPPAGSGVGNAVATRLPSAGVRYVPARRKVEPKLRFPDTLKAQGIEADVKVSISIDATGKVTGVRILTPSPYPEFNEEARATALGEQFEPATRDGTPIPYSLAFTYRFRLQDE